jgi:hypothetical protein
MKLVLGRIFSAFITAGGWLLAGIRLVLDLIGYSTIPEDVSVAKGRLDQFFDLILTAPWWVIWGFAFFSTLWLIWVSWPRHSQVDSGGATLQKGSNPANDSARQELAVEAQQLASKIGSLLAEHGAKTRLAWSSQVQTTLKGGAREDEVAKADVWLLERYGDYYGQITRVVMKARKFIALDQNDLWIFGAKLNAAHDVQVAFHLLQTIAVSLENTQPDFPLKDRFAEALRARAKANSAADRQPQSHRDTGQKKRP